MLEVEHELLGAQVKGGRSNAPRRMPWWHTTPLPPTAPQDGSLELPHAAHGSAAAGGTEAAAAAAAALLPHLMPLSAAPAAATAALLHPHALAPALGAAPALPLLVADVGRIAVRQAHAFPSAPSAQLHIGLALRRRAAATGYTATQLPPGAAPPPGVAGGMCGRIVARLPAAATLAGGPGGGAGGPGGGAGGRRRQVTRLLLLSLSRGARDVSGWLAAAELLLEDGAAEAALEAAKEVRRPQGGKAGEEESVGRGPAVPLPCHTRCPP
jgi:hypothetical protein